MEQLQELNRKARALESAGQDAAALECYLRALAAEPRDGRGHLLARAGLLQLRLGHAEEAAQSLAAASDLYVEAGLRNDALALCHRVLRAHPARVDFLRRVARLSAEQGYPADARRSVEALADRLQEAGDDDGAAEALREHLRAFPSDTAIRERLAALGVAQPEPTVIPDRQAEPPSPPSGDDLGLMSFAPESAPEPAPPAPVADGAVADDDLPLAASTPGIAPLEGLEPTHSGADDWSRDAGSIAITGSSFEIEEPPPNPGAGEEADSDAAADDPLPLLAPDGSAPAAAAPLVAGAVEEVEAGESEGVDELPTLEPGERDEGETELPMLGAEELPGLDPTAELSAARAAAAAAGDHGRAADLAARLAALRPDDVALLQLWAEHAFRSGDRERLVAAYLAVARRFAALGQEEPARKIYERVARLDPGNEEARQGARVAPEPAHDFVDFGALVLDEESTRFQVEPGFPTGDEERDFREILTAFRDQITTGIDAGDATSHYDLGLAFKEMGLWDDAVTQMERALRAGSPRAATLEVLGECYLEKGDPQRAVDTLDEALRHPGTPAGDLVGVHYWLGRAHEALGAAGPARESLERVVAVDPGFRDAASRLGRLPPT